MKSGRGTYTSADGKYKYEGTWKDNQKFGFGHEKYPDGLSYEGTFIRGKKHGKGIDSNYQASL